MSPKGARLLRRSLGERSEKLDVVWTGRGSQARRKGEKQAEGRPRRRWRENVIDGSGSGRRARQPVKCSPDNPGVFPSCPGLLGLFGAAGAAA